LSIIVVNEPEKHWRHTIAIATAKAFEVFSVDILRARMAALRIAKGRCDGNASFGMFFCCRCFYR
jgi:hypothetical protein